jgi:hypothetical protein
MDDEDKAVVMGKAVEFIEECVDNQMAVVLIAINEETGSFRMSTIDADALDTMHMLLAAARVMEEASDAQREGRTLN